MARNALPVISYDVPGLLLGLFLFGLVLYNPESCRLTFSSPNVIHMYFLLTVLILFKQASNENFRETTHLPLPKPNINTYFSLWEKC